MAKPLSFEQNLQSLELIVSQLEKGDLALEESLKQFEKGIALAHKCQEMLQQAEQKIKHLGLEPSGDFNV